MKWKFRNSSPTESMDVQWKTKNEKKRIDDSIFFLPCVLGRSEAGGKKEGIVASRRFKFSFLSFLSLSFSLSSFLSSIHLFIHPLFLLQDYHFIHSPSFASFHRFLGFVVDVSDRVVREESKKKKRFSGSLSSLDGSSRCPCLTAECFIFHFFFFHFVFIKLTMSRWIE